MRCVINNVINEAQVYIELLFRDRICVFLVSVFIIDYRLSS